MPGIHDVHHASAPHFTITTLASPGDPVRARLCLAGEIDNAADDLLRACVEWLTTLAPASLTIDLAEVTFAGAALPNFVVHACGALSEERLVILAGANPLTRWVLQVTDMAGIATITTDTSRTLR